MEAATTQVSEAIDLHSEFTEARRRTAERYFFARNPRLAKEAKQNYGAICQACGFDFQTFYGELGEGYIEVHHLNPLSERPEREWTDVLCTSLAKVAVLCANCHRMAHRRRPALAVEELQKIIKNNSYKVNNR